MLPIMINRPPTIRIKQNIGRMPSSNMLLLNLILLIDGTFSTPTGDYANNPMEVMAVALSTTLATGALPDQVALPA